MSRTRAWQLSFAALLFGALLFKLSETHADADLWGHLRFGADVLASRQAPRVDTYSYTSAGLPWIDHEWLAEAAFAAVYARAGAPGLIAVKLALAMAFVAILFRHVRRALAPLPAALLIAWSAVLLAPGLLTVRPQLFTYLFFAVELVAIDRAAVGRRAIWILPVVFLLWANVHGGWLAGLLALLVWAICARTREAWLVFVASAAATLANPYGIGLWRFILTAIHERRDIAEWNPIELASLPGLIVVSLIVIGAIALARRRRDASPQSVAIFVLTSLLPFRSMRHLPLFVAAVLVLVGSVRSSAEADGDSVVRRAWIAALPLAAAVFLAALTPRHFGCILVDPRDYPIGAVAALRQSGARGRLLVFYDWGEYAIWHLAPAVKVSIDGRRETVYPDRVNEENDRFQAGAADWQAALRDGSPDFVLTSPRFPAASRMTGAAGWRIGYQDGASILFVRGGVAALPPIAPAVSSCFP